jgi:predicted secreted hydrolase
MRTKFCLLLLILSLAAPGQEYRPALPGYHYEFPRDHFSHPEYRTEWWYYTGNLRAQDGRRFGFELTFFRQGIARNPNPSPWYIHDLYMAHLALSDISRGRYYATERVNRAGPGIAGADATSGTIWNGNWQTRIQGMDGVSQKGEGAGHASHYISFTRMSASGTVELNGSAIKVDGDAWMDHEFFSDAANGDEVGWDWLSLQFDDKSELMLYRLRHKDGSIDPYSSGMFVDSSGKALHLARGDFSMTPAGSTWKSEKTGANYPVAWSVEIPSLKLEIAVSTPLNNQEFVSRFGPSYWEGAIDLEGRRGNEPVRGFGYLEMTGYAEGTPWLGARNYGVNVR